jgi:hypothetical protein
VAGESGDPGAPGGATSPGCSSLAACLVAFLEVEDNGPDPEVPIGVDSSDEYTGGAGEFETDPGIPPSPEDPVPLTMTLARTDRQTNAALSVDAGYYGGPDAQTYFNGGGVAGVGALELSLARDGGGVTVAVRWFAQAGDVQGGVNPDQPQQLVGFRGVYQANPLAESGTAVLLEGAEGPSPYLVLRQVIAGVPTEQQLSAPGSVPADAPVNIVVRLRRWHGRVQVGAWVAGTRVDNGGVTADLAGFELGTLVVGDLHRSDGGFSRLAMWKRPLRDAELEREDPPGVPVGVSFGCMASADFPGVGGGGPDSDDPFLTPCGESALQPEFPVERVDMDGVVIETDGPQRHARTPHETRPRRYRLRFSLADGAQVELIRRALEVTQHGAGWTRWRHPIDDEPGPVSTAPRYFIVNADAVGQAIGRGPGGHLAQLELVLESLDL